MAPFTRYPILKFYQFVERHFWKAGYVLLAIACGFLLYMTLLSIYNVETKNAQHIGAARQQQKDRAIMKRLK